MRIDFFSIDQSGLRQLCGVQLFTKREVEKVGNRKEDEKQWQEYIESGPTRPYFHS